MKKKRVAGTRLVPALLVVPFLSNCATPELDRRISALRSQIAEQQATLRPLADPYRGTPGKDVQMQITSRPLHDVVETYNGLDDHSIQLQSIERRGYIAEHWNDCPWPLGRWGYRIHAAHDKAFAGVIIIDRIGSSWSEKDGLVFSLKHSVGAAGIVIGAYVEACFGGTDLPIGFAAVVAGAHSAGGITEIQPVAEGIQYKLTLTQPIYMIAYVWTPFFSTPVPLYFTTTLTKGKIPHILGREGSVQITKTGELRRYVLDIRLDEAHFLPSGLSASGPVSIRWLPTSTGAALTE